MIFEICTDNVAGVLAAQKYHAKRVELCSALSVGGLTPSIGLVEECAKNTTVELHTMIRHKEGDFKYTHYDIPVMKRDIVTMAKAGAKGVVFGVLNTEDRISNYTKELVDISKNNNLEVTFHRAFDFIKKPDEAFEQLIELGVDRLLTSGGEKTAIEGIENIVKWQKKYGNHIQIMAGSGVNASNALDIAQSGIQNLHFTAKKVIKNTNLSMGEQTVVDEEKIKQIMAVFK